MARRKANRSATSGWGRWWWLALPVLGVAAWAAFDATLGLVSSDRPAETAPLLDAAPRAAIAPQEPAPVAAEEAAAPAATLAPVAIEPSATPAARAAADGQKAAKRKPPAPKENITEQDRRALERVLERATEQGTR